MSASCGADTRRVDAWPYQKRTKQRLKAHLHTLDNLDRRTNAARNAERLIAGIQSDLGKDMSYAQGELAKRAALLSVLAEDCEVRWLRGQPVVIGDYVAVVNAERRLLATLGLERQPREINGNDSDNAEISRLLSYFEGPDESEATNANS